MRGSALFGECIKIVCVIGGLLMSERIYALYHGEKNVMDGTLAEISQRHGSSVKTLKFMLSPTYKRRRAQAVKKGRAVFELVEITED